MKEPSEKQIAFAILISKVTNKPLPKENTAQAYFLYIQDNIEEYRKLKAEKQRKCKYNRNTTRKRVYNCTLDDEEDASWAAAMDFGWM